MQSQPHAISVCVYSSYVEIHVCLCASVYFDRCRKPVGPCSSQSRSSVLLSVQSVVAVLVPSLVSAAVCVFYGHNASVAFWGRHEIQKSITALEKTRQELRGDALVSLGNKKCSFFIYDSICIFVLLHLVHPDKNIH